MIHFWSTGCKGISIWIGDGYCDDTNNNEGCDFDGGDCCGSNVITELFFFDGSGETCKDCICYEDLNCAASLELIGNGFCNDEGNTPGCSYDGGDCCGACINTDFCSECLCLEGGEPAIDLSCKLSLILTYVS